MKKLLLLVVFVAGCANTIQECQVACGPNGMLRHSKQSCDCKDGHNFGPVSALADLRCTLTPFFGK